ncbi:MAG: alpha/beta fold hydrolase [Actinomycetota bacterium]
MIVLHGGPGLDHHEFGDYLDPLTEQGVRLVMLDLRAHGMSGPSDPATWTLERHAQDVIMLALAMGLDRYVVYGHSYGAFVALQNAVDYPGIATATIASSGVPSTRWLAGIEGELAAFEPAALRERVAASWARETEVRTPEDVVELITDQLPFHFADPSDPRMDEYIDRSQGMIGAPDVLRHFAASEYGGIHLEDRLLDVRHPVLLLAGRHDRACPAAASEYMAKLIPGATLHVFEHAGHMSFVEEPEAYIEAMTGFLAARGLLSR